MAVESATLDGGLDRAAQKDQKMHESAFDRIQSQTNQRIAGNLPKRGDQRKLLRGPAAGDVAASNIKYLASPFTLRAESADYPPHPPWGSG